MQLVQIIISKGLVLPSVERIKGFENKTLPTVTQCVLDNGMVYVVQICDGSFVLIGGEIGLYKLIDPEMCLWSTSEARFNGTLEGQKFQFCTGEGDCDFNSWLRDDSIRKRIHYHLGQTATVTGG